MITRARFINEVIQLKIYNDSIEKVDNILGSNLMTDSLFSDVLDRYGNLLLGSISIMGDYVHIPDEIYERFWNMIFVTDDNEIAKAAGEFYDNLIARPVA